MSTRSSGLFLAVASLCVALGALAVVVVRNSTSRNTAASDDFVFQEQLEAIRARDETGPAIARMAKIGNTADFSSDDATYLLRVLEKPFEAVKSEARAVGKKIPTGIDEADTIVLQRWALLTVADRLRQSEMDDAMRQSLENAILGFLDHDQWRLRRRAILSLGEAEIASRADIRECIRRLEADPRPEVASAALQVLEAQ